MVPRAPAGAGVTDHRTIPDLARARAAAAIERDDYWAAMREHHVGLLDYLQLLTRAGFEALEIGADGLLLRDRDGVRWSWQPDQVRSPLTVRLNDGAYEERVGQLLAALAATTAVVLDVGANIGYYSVQLARVPSVRRVHAFEPIPGTCAVLRRNVELNDLGSTIAIHETALSDRTEVATFFVPTDTGNVAASARPLFEEQDQERVEVQVERLDDIALDTTVGDIGLVKCDIEGGEFSFLRGAERTLLANRPFVMLEMLRKWSAKYGYTPNDIIAWMLERGFRCYAFDGPVARVTSVDEATVETNFLFAHSDRLETLWSALSSRFEIDGLD